MEIEGAYWFYWEYRNEDVHGREIRGSAAFMCVDGFSLD